MGGVQPSRFWSVGSAVAPAVAAAKAAALAAPAPGALQYQAQTISFLGQNAFPDLSFDRHFINGSGIGSADLPTVTKPYYYTNTWNDLGGPTNNENDGSAARFWTTAKGMGSVQAFCPMYVAFQTPSRYLWIPSISTRVAQIRVDGKLLPAGSVVTWPSNNNMAKIDFGSVAAGAGRKIVIQCSPDMWFAEICVSAGSPVIPYDWQVDAGKVSASFMGDSYQQNSDYSLVGLPFAQYIAELCGFGAITQSSIGNTSFDSNGGLPTYPNFQAAERLAQVTRENPTVHMCQGGINSPGDSGTTAAMTAYFSAFRAQSASSLIVAQTAWSPKQTDGQNPGGKYQAMRTALYSVMAGVSGPWILIDNLAGQWSTSKGTSSGAGTGPWQTGDGNVGAPTGTGNGDIYVSADGTHPTPAGAKYLAERVAASYKAGVASM